MKIKLGILEKDHNYLDRIVAVLGAKYAENLELYAFTNPDVAFSTAASVRLDVFLSSDSFDVDKSCLPERCGFAYFVESQDVESVNGQVAICKFQKVDLIYKHILSIYSEHIGSISGFKFGDSATKVIAFQSVSGGAGSSSLAAACAVHFSRKNNKVLYLNLERFGKADLYFSAEGQFSMSDVIYALKRRKTNLSLKFESCARRDSTGVFFFQGTKIALDMLELNVDDLIRLVDELRLMGEYDYIVVDMDFVISKEMLNFYHRFHALIWVGDGSEVSNTKLARAYETITTLDSMMTEPIANRVLTAYNKFSKSLGRVIELGAKNIGGAPRIDGHDMKQIVDRLSQVDMFDRIF